MDDYEITFKIFKKRMENFTPESKEEWEFYNAGYKIGKQHGIEACLEYIEEILREKKELQ